MQGNALPHEKDSRDVAAALDGRGAARQNRLTTTRTQRSADENSTFMRSARGDWETAADMSFFSLVSPLHRRPHASFPTRLTDHTMKQLYYLVNNEAFSPSRRDYIHAMFKLWR